MKVRVRHGGTTVKVGCEKATLLSELSSLAAEQLGLVDGPITLSLNLKDALGDPSDSLGASGVCGGDLLHVLCAASAASAVGAAPAPPVREVSILPPVVSAAPLDTLLEMGFPPDACAQALQACDGSLDGAVGLLAGGAFDAPAPASTTATAASASRLEGMVSASLQAVERRAAKAAPMEAQAPPGSANQAPAPVFEPAAREEFLDLLLQAGFQHRASAEHDLECVTRLDSPSLEEGKHGVHVTHLTGSGTGLALSASRHPRDSGCPPRRAASSATAQAACGPPRGTVRRTTP
jgi:hypothetical protein